MGLIWTQKGKMSGKRILLFIYAAGTPLIAASILFVLLGLVGLPMNYWI